MKDNIISHQITTDVVTCFNVQFVIINQVSISSWLLSLCLYYSLFPYIVVISYRFKGELLLKKNYVYALVTIYKTILHYHRCFRYWSSLYLVNRNMDCWVEINIKLDIFLDSICCLQHTWKEGYGNDCLCFVFFFYFLLLYPPIPPKRNSLGPATTYSWKSIDPTKIICKQSLCTVLVCTGPSPQINIARSLM